MHRMQRAINQRHITHSRKAVVTHLHVLLHMKIVGMMPADIQTPWVFLHITEHILQLPSTPQWTVVVALFPEGLKGCWSSSRQVRRAQNRQRGLLLCR